MPIYQYTALNEKGEKVSGELDADSPRDARNKLRNLKIFVTDMKVLEEVAPVSGDLSLSQAAGKKLSVLAQGLVKPRSVGRRLVREITGGIGSFKRLEEIATVTRQLATLLAAGITLTDALQALTEQVERKDMELVLRDVREKLMEGQTLGSAMERHPKFFDELYVNMVRAGEASGALDSILMRVADYLHKQYRMRARILAALTYPIVMSVVGVGVVIFLLSVVVPRITQLLIQQKKALPLVTEILIGVSDFIRTYFIGIVAVFLALWVVYRLAMTTRAGKWTRDVLLLRMPVFGSLFKKQAISRFSLTLATLLESGLPVLDSINIVKRVVNNLVLAKTLDEVHDRVLAGTDISTPLRKSGVFPPVVSYMVAIGEESGQLEKLLKKVAESYDEEIEIASQKIASVIEPIMILLMALIVGFIVLAVLLPILEMSRIR